MLSFINTEVFDDISGYDIELINMNLRYDVNDRRIRLLKEHLNFDLEKEYIDFLEKNIAAVFKIHSSEKLIMLHYAYEALSQNLKNEMYEKFLNNGTIIGKIIDVTEKNICILKNENNESYRICTIDNNYDIIKIGDSFVDIFTNGIGIENF